MTGPTHAPRPHRAGEKAPASMVDCFHDALTAEPLNATYRFFDDVRGEPVPVADGELDTRSRALAVELLEVVSPGDRVLIVCPPGPDYLTAFIGCLYAGVVAVPVYPVDPVNAKRTLPRLRRVVRDATAGALVAPSFDPALRALLEENAPELVQVPWVCLDSPRGDADRWRHPGIGPDDVAFLQYTSGSTGTPKGVMVGHGNLVANLACINREFFGDADPANLHLVSWLPPYHDMGLIGGLMQPVFGRFPVTIMNPVSFLKRPLAWLELISSCGGTVSGGPNFAYDLCVTKRGAADLESLDLSRWVVAFNGAEPVRAETLERFATVFEPAGFRREAFMPCYGLAENGLMATTSRRETVPTLTRVDPASLEAGSPVPAADGRVLVGSGVVGGGGELAIVDPTTCGRVEDGTVGEVWLRGPSVAHGYWGNPLASEETFGGMIVGEEGGGDWLRTGDLGFVADGELYVTGRHKDLIVLDGRNIYPQDVEASVGGAHPLLLPGGGVVCESDSGDGPRIVVIHEVKGSPDPATLEEIATAVRSVAADEHLLPVDDVVLLRRGGTLKTSSGKLRRRDSAATFRAGGFDALHTWSRPETGRGVSPPSASAEPTPATTGTVQPGTSGPRSGTETTGEAAGPGADELALRDWLSRAVAESAGIPVSQVTADAPLSSFGLGSTQLVVLAGDLERHLGRPVPSTAAWNHPSITALAAHLSGRTLDAAVSGAGDGRARAVPGSFAVVGMSCRFPGAAGLSDYWRVLVDGVDAITEVPADRWDVEEFYDPAGVRPGTATTKWGGFVAGIDEFDPGFFGISPREAAEMDPQQRLFLEVAWEAIEDAGLTSPRLRGSRTGVFVGVSTSDHARAASSDPARISAFTGTGNAGSIVANRLSYVLDLRGPSMAIDTACSSSLVAINQACESLASGACDVAVAGGVNAILAPDLAINFSRAGAMAADGRCKAFDESADGYVRGEGSGVVILKPLDRAVADGDRIYAVIIGGAVNQDGRTNGLMAPNQSSQEAVLRSAYGRAGASPAAVGYVEAHGTGTLLGDPIEVRALASVLGDGRARGEDLRIGSAKTNIGHLEAAAGVAGFIKTALALYHEAIPPSLHFHKPNPHIDFDSLPVAVVQEATPWSCSGTPRVAGVSSFGFGGTNAHVVLEEAPVRTPEPTAGSGRLLLQVSARDPQALRRVAAGYARRLEGAGPVEAAAVCRTAALHRTYHEHRLACTAASASRLRQSLSRWAATGECDEVVTGRAIGHPEIGVAFVFPGQGSRWWPIGDDLLGTPSAFEATLRRADSWMRSETGWSVIDAVTGAGASELSTHPSVAQPALIATQVALASWWVERGVVPRLTLGHSVGEISAACVAGAISLEDGLAIARARGRAIETARTHGAMAFVGLPAAEVTARLESEGRDDVWVSAVNGPARTLVSGVRSSVLAWHEHLESQGEFSRMLEEVQFGSHCPLMDEVLDTFREELGSVTASRPAIPMISSASGTWLADDLGTDYWLGNLRSPVLFADAVATLGGDRVQHVLEVSPHQSLTTMIEENLQHGGHPGVAVASLRRDEPALPALDGALARLFCHGARVSWNAVHGPDGGVVDLPPYPWSHVSHALPPTGASASAGRRTIHPFIQTLVTSAAEPNRSTAEGTLDIARQPWLAEHVVEGSQVLPATGILDLLLTVAKRALGRSDVALADVCLRSVVPVVTDPAADPTAVQVSVQVHGERGGWVRLHARTGTDPWVLAADGRMVAEVGTHARRSGPVEGRAVDLAGMRAGFARQGIEYGDSFHGLHEAYETDDGVRGVIRDGDAGWPTGPHPATLDACLQVLAALPDARADKGARVPVRVGRFESRSGASVIVTALGRRDPDAITHGGVSVTAYDAEGEPVATLSGIEFQAIRPERAPHEEVIRELGWTAAELDVEPAAGTREWAVVAASDEAVRVVDGLLPAESVTLLSLHQPAPEGAALVGDDEALTARLAALGAAGAVGVLVVHVGDDALPDHAPGAGPVNDLLRCARLLDDLEGVPDRRLVVLTRRGAHVTAGDPPPDPVAAALWGAARSLTLEAQALSVAAVDVDPATGDDPGVGTALSAAGLPSELARRTGEWLVPRLRSQPASDPSRWPARTVAEEGRADPFRILAREPGVLSSLAAVAMPSRQLGAHEVAIEVAGAGLNFSDVLKALDICPGIGPGRVPLGAECSGVVTDVGSAVKRVRPGDRVMAIAESSLGRSAVTPEELVAVVPDDMDLVRAGGAPIAFLTAWTGLRHLARLSPGELVLIHSATGGVGMAAIQVARMCGATVLATAGTETKRDLLRSMGVEMVYDSRSTDFAEHVMNATEGRGVDVVGNSLAGAGLVASMSVLAENGRFVEIGKRDVYDDTLLGLRTLVRNRSLLAVDLEALASSRPDRLTPLFDEVAAALARGDLTLLPTTVFDMTRAVDAFTLMAQARHTGKVVLEPSGVTEVLVPPEAFEVRADATYLVTGGLGDLGLHTAEVLADRGARHLALASRRAPSRAAEERLGRLMSRGVVVETHSVDVGDSAAVADLVGNLAVSMPPLRGVVHAAGLLSDASFRDHDPERVERLWRPKVTGAWNLHQATLGRELDLFVTYSSAAAVLGSPGQTGYAAANAALGALSRHRRALGLPATDIAWGPWAEVGLAARQGSLAQLERRGIVAITPALGAEVLHELLGRQDDAVVLAWDPDAAGASSADTPEALRDLVGSSGHDGAGSPASLRAVVEAAQPGRPRRQVLGDICRKETAAVLRTTPESVDLEAPLADLGLDSLMSVELCKRLERTFDVQLPATLVFRQPTLSALSEFVAERMGLPLDPGATSTRTDAPRTLALGAEPGAAESTTGEDVAPDPDMADLTEAELEALLAAELDSVDRDGGRDR